MIKYDKKDIDLLFNQFMSNSVTEGKGLKGNEGACTYITIQGKKVAISCDTLIKIVFGNPTIRDSIDREVFNIYALIHVIPIEHVPLFLNIIPEVAKWRLEIRK